MPKRTSLPSMLPAGRGVSICHRRRRGERRVAGLLLGDRIAATTAGDEDQVIAASTAQPWRGRRPCAEGEAERRGIRDRQHLQEVGERRRVLERMRRVGVEEAAAVGAEHLDRHLRRDRPPRSVCVR